MKKLLYVLLFLSITSCSSTEPPTVPIKIIKNADAPFVLKTLVKDIDGVPWAIKILPDGNFLISLREGALKLFNPKTNALKNIVGVPKVVAESQGGLLDLALHPEFKTNKTIFISFSGKFESMATTKLASAIYDGEKLTNVKEIFVALPAQKTFHHYGSRIAFDKKGHLFLSIGERGQRNLAQDLNAHMGKIIRLNLDGSIPNDNPYVGKTGYKPEIWSYGHRNPQGLFYDSETDELWVNEHGPKGGDEINLVLKAKNYGWPIATYGREYYGPLITENTTLPNVESPRHVWLPSIAPSDLLIYKSNAISSWKGHFLSGALALEHLNLVKVQKGKSVSEERYLTELEERIRSLAVDSDGRLIIGTDGGMILQLSAR
ncbi:MAG: dehydrogenase [Bdellovibrionales bacterium CG12_big_fil_rev_8_21_14_0_65_38_15]|nr:MAG: dehydrogenase [Bdellovibrionales bacterium CG22_combo_CG10-13_8_21_14_all_38_13]PIQ52837.1 MAG: dehydrogenase [Bdellovibrionales bacterium CG12_big_fil_rev_8_21_14_0_65_38_15]